MDWLYQIAGVLFGVFFCIAWEKYREKLLLKRAKRYSISKKLLQTETKNLKDNLETLEEEVFVLEAHKSKIEEELNSNKEKKKNLLGKQEETRQLEAHILTLEAELSSQRQRRIEVSALLEVKTKELEEARFDALAGEDKIKEYGEILKRLKDAGVQSRKQIQSVELEFKGEKILNGELESKIQESNQALQSTRRENDEMRQSLLLQEEEKKKAIVATEKAKKEKERVEKEVQELQARCERIVAEYEPLHKHFNTQIKPMVEKLENALPEDEKSHLKKARKSNGRL